MISKRMNEALNTQMNFENESAHVYLAMASYLRKESLDGASSWMIKQYKEEKFHGKKMYNYIHEQDGDVVITGFETPKNEYQDILDVLETALAHEKEVTRRIYDLMKLAKEENDYATEVFLAWYIEEQVEEEDTLRDLISRYHLYPKAHLLIFDREMGSRE